MSAIDGVGEHGPLPSVDEVRKWSDVKFRDWWPRVNGVCSNEYPPEFRAACYERFSRTSPYDPKRLEREQARSAAKNQEQQPSDSTVIHTSGAETLNAVRNFIARFIAFPTSDCLDAVTLWAAHTHMVEHFHTTPRLAVLSPEPESGKTRTLEVLDLLTPKPMLIFSPSPAAIFRKLAREQVTLLFDEVDVIFRKRGKDDQNEDLRSLLNMGYRRGASIPRCVGPQHEVQDFRVFAATALAGIGDLPETLMTRAIVIRMRRRSASEVIEQFRLRVHEAEGHVLRDRLALWAAAVGPSAGAAWPALPEGITDRRAEAWEPLIAVGDAGGGDWPTIARRACRALVAAKDQQRVSLGVRLLGDLRTIFGEAVAMHTQDILDRLCNPQASGLDADAPWPELRGRPLAERGLATLLKRYGVAPVKVNIGGRVLQGYRRDALWDAWVRYITPPSVNAEPAEPAELAGQRDHELPDKVPDIPLAGTTEGAI